MLCFKLLHERHQGLHALQGHGIVIEARMPPTLRWPFRFTRPFWAASAQKALSSSGEGEVKVTFIMLRNGFSTGFLKKREASR